MPSFPHWDFLGGLALPLGFLPASPAFSCTVRRSCGHEPLGRMIPVLAACRTGESKGLAFHPDLSSSFSDPTNSLSR